MTITVPRRAASALHSPMIGSLWVCSRSSAAFVFARSGSREPMMIEWPTSAHRVASPAPSLPVPPRIAMFMAPGVLSKEVARGIAQERLRPFLARLEPEPAHDRRRNAVELAHDRLGRAGELIRQRQDRRLQRAAGRIAFAEVAEERRSEERRVGKECRSRWSPYH